MTLPTGSPSTTWTPSWPSRGGPEFSFRLLIATTDLIGRTAKRTIEAQEKQASVLLLGDLEAAEVDWPASPSDLRAPAAATETTPASSARSDERGGEGV